MQARSPLHQNVINLLAMLHRALDATTTWVTQLSWWKFILFAAVALIAANILQDELFSGSYEEEVVEQRVAGEPRARGKQTEANILIDDSGIHFSTRPPVKSGKVPAPPLPPVPPDATPSDAAPAKETSPFTTTLPDGGESVHIELPPQIGEELSNAIEAAVEHAAEEKVSRYKRKASTWFKSFVMLLLLALLATKALVGGKVGSSRVDLQACKLEYSIVSPK